MTRQGFLALGIAAFIYCLGAGAATSGTVLVSFDGYCNVETITTGLGQRPSAMSETDDGCDENTGVGGPSKVAGRGATVGFGWRSANSPGAATELVFTQPYQTGGTVFLYYTVDGQTEQLATSTTYTVVAAGERSPRAGNKPISATVPH